MLLPPAVLLAVELVLRLVGFGHPTRFFLPAIEGGREVWIENPYYGCRYFPPGLERAPRTLCFPRVKAPDAVRIFVIGESAALGDPEPSVGFARILEVLLRSAWPGKRLEVINVAMTAINSHAARDIARECARLQGDYWFVYLGHNEVVGPFGAGTVFGAQTPPPTLLRAQLALQTTRLGQLLSRIYWRLRPADGRPEEWAGPAMFQQHTVTADDPRLERVYASFEANLRDILGQGCAAGARVIVSTVASNLRDCAPFASAHRPGLTAAQLDEWRRWYEAGLGAWRTNQPLVATSLLARALAIDDGFASAQFALGRAELALGWTNASRGRFEQALAQDALRFRGDARINQIIRDVAAGTPGCERVDLAAILGASSRGGLPGSEFFHEHVHFNFEGNYLVATQLAAVMLGERRGRPGPPDSRVCAERLGFTDFDRYRVLDEVRQRLSQPPFTGQIDHETQLERIRAEMKPLESGQFSAARRTYEKAIADWPDDWALRENFGTLLNDFQQHAEALEQWRRMVELVPHSVDACLGLADALDGLGRVDESIAWIRLALQRQPDGAATRHALALALLRGGRVAEAVTELQRVIRAKPRDAEAHVDLGTALARLGRRADAEQQWREALRLQPANARARALRGR